MLSRKQILPTKMRQLMLKLIMALHSEKKNINQNKTGIGSTKLLSISPMTHDLLRPRGKSHAWPPGKRRNGHPETGHFQHHRVATKEHGRSTSPKPIPLTTSAWCLDDLTKTVPGCHSKKTTPRKTILWS